MSNIISFLKNKLNFNRVNIDSELLPVKQFITNTGKINLKFKFTDSKIFSEDLLLSKDCEQFFIGEFYSKFKFGIYDVYRFYNIDTKNFVQLSFKNNIFEDGLYFELNEDILIKNIDSIDELDSFKEEMKSQQIEIDGKKLIRDIEDENLEKINLIYIKEKIKNIKQIKNADITIKHNELMLYHFDNEDDDRMISIQIEKKNKSKNQDILIYNTYFISTLL